MHWIQVRRARAKTHVGSYCFFFREKILSPDRNCNFPNHTIFLSVYPVDQWLGRRKGPETITVCNLYIHGEHNDLNICKISCFCNSYQILVSVWQDCFFQLSWQNHASCWYENIKYYATKENNTKIVLIFCPLCFCNYRHLKSVMMVLNAAYVKKGNVEKFVKRWLRPE